MDHQAVREIVEKVDQALVHHFDDEQSGQRKDKREAVKNLAEAAAAAFRGCEVLRVSAVGVDAYGTVAFSVAVKTPAIAETTVAIVEIPEAKDGADSIVNVRAFTARDVAEWSAVTLLSHPPQPLISKRHPVDPAVAAVYTIVNMVAEKIHLWLVAQRLLRRPQDRSL